MFTLRNSVSAFALSENGAVTVDWVVLTGSLVGLGLAVLGVVSGGVEQLSRSISDTMSGYEIQTAFAEALANLGIASLDFSGDNGGFSGGGLASVSGIGDVFQIAPNATAAASFGLPDGASEAVVEFDLMGLDSLNNETATISVNGEVAGTVTVSNGVANFSPAGGGDTTFEAFNTHGGSDLTGDGHSDSITQIRMTTTNPGGTLDLEIHSGTSAGVDNESFAIDNVNVSAT